MFSRALVFMLIKVIPPPPSYNCVDLIECLIYAENIQHALYIAKNLYDSRAKKKDDASYTHELSECLYIYGKTLSQCVNGITNVFHTSQFHDVGQETTGKGSEIRQKERAGPHRSYTAVYRRQSTGESEISVSNYSSLEFFRLLYLLPYHPSLFIQNLLIDILSRHEDYEETLYYLQTALKYET